jgi:phage protein D
MQKPLNPIGARRYQALVEARKRGEYVSPADLLTQIISDEQYFSDAEQSVRRTLAVLNRIERETKVRGANVRDLQIEAGSALARLIKKLGYPDLSRVYDRIRNDG